jgi:hypothetical protein
LHERNIGAVLRTLREKEIDYWFARVNADCDRMVHVFTTVYGANVKVVQLKDAAAGLVESVSAVSSC